MISLRFNVIYDSALETGTETGTQHRWRLKKERFALQGLSSWENIIPCSSCWSLLYTFVWWKADGGCLVESSCHFLKHELH